MDVLSRLIRRVPTDDPGWVLGLKLVFEFKGLLGETDSRRKGYNEIRLYNQLENRALGR